MTQPVTSGQIPVPLKQGVKATVKTMPAKHATVRRSAAAKAAVANKAQRGQ